MKQGDRKMKTVAIIAAIIGITASAYAADIVVDLGSLTVPDAAVADVQEWLATQVRYTIETTIETRTDPDTGESVDVEIKTQAPVAETPRAKLTRIMRAAAVDAVANPVRQLRQERADAAAQAAAQAEMDALPNPVAE
jgi:hypothetical protein